MVGGEAWSSQRPWREVEGEEQVEEQSPEGPWDSTQAVSLIPCHGSFLQ